MRASAERQARRDARSQRVIGGLRLARWNMGRDRGPRGIDAAAVFARIERGATAQELIDAAAGLAVAPTDKQGRLL